jgi:hypothetical protein
MACPSSDPGRAGKPTRSTTPTITAQTSAADTITRLPRLRGGEIPPKSASAMAGRPFADFLEFSQLTGETAMGLFKQRFQALNETGVGTPGFSVTDGQSEVNAVSAQPRQPRPPPGLLPPWLA